MFQKPKDTPTIYKIITPFFIISLAVMIYGIVIADFSVSTIAVIILVILYAVLKKKSPLRSG